MTRSKEYLDLPWVEPRSWTNANRTAVQLVVIHTTEGSAHARSAEDGAAYDARRADGTSCHYFHDSDTTIQCVLTADIAHTARGQGNRRGIHHELCTKAGSAQWHSLYHTSMLLRTAKQVARDCRKWQIPARKLTPAQVKAGEKGICGHVDISDAFGQSDHTDPGKGFPWARFVGMVQAELNPPPAPSKGNDMPSAEEIAAAVWNYDVDRAKVGTQTAAGYLTTENARSGENRTVVEPDQSRRLQEIEEKVARQQETLDAILAAVTPTEPDVPPVV